MPNGKPDPQCKDCKGRGQITLLTSSCICNCVNRVEPGRDMKFIDKIYKIKEFNNDLFNIPANYAFPDKPFEIGDDY